MAMPIMFTWRDIRYGTRGAIGSANGGSQMRVGKRRRLVMHVDDLRLPLPPGVLHHARLDHVEHVGVAIVVVADVLLIQLRHRRQLERRADVARYHSATIVWPSGLIVGQSSSTTLSRMALMSGSSALRQQVVRQLQRVLRAGDLAGVKSAVDVHERVALREPARERPARSAHPDVPAGARSRDSDRAWRDSRPKRSRQIDKSAPAWTSPPRPSSCDRWSRPGGESN